MKVPFNGYWGVIYCDVHSMPFDVRHPSYNTFTNFVRENKPDLAINLGDHFDFHYISKYSREEKHAAKGVDFRADYIQGNVHFDFMQEHVKDNIYIEGNHEYRIESYLKSFPQLKGMIEVDINLNLQKRGIPWIREATNQPFKLGKCNFIHGKYFNKYHTSKHLEMYGGNIVYGHVHSHQAKMVFPQCAENAIMAMSVPCLTDRNPDWKKGMPTGWTQGFAVIEYMKSGNFNIHPIIMVNNCFIFNGKFYTPHGVENAK